MSLQNLNLIFDISVLAWSVKNNKAKTGVFRVVENLLFQFLKDPEINLYLTSSHGNIIDLRLYFKNENICISEDKLLIPKNANLFRDKMFLALNWTITKIERKNFPKVSKYLLNIYKFILSPFLFLIGLNSYLYQISNSYLNKNFIYHSPYLPLPNYITKSNISKVITIHDVVPLIYPDYFVGNKDHVVWKIIRDLNDDIKILTMSKYNKTDILKIKPDLFDSQIFITPWGATKSFYPITHSSSVTSLLEKYSLSPNKYILTVSTLEPRKNLKTVILSFVEFCKVEINFDIKLVIVGGKGWGISLDDLQSLYSENLADRILFLGFVSNEELNKIYSGAISFIFLSYYEGFGLPVLEAMQTGLPVICSNSSSLPEVVGDAGMLVDPDDIPMIVSKLSKLLKNKKLRETYKAKSIIQAKKFNWETTTYLTKIAYKSDL